MSVVTFALGRTV